MSMASSTRQPSSKPTPSGIGNTPATQRVFHSNSRILPSLTRPTASSSSKASTPLLPPSRMLPPAHMRRHNKSSSLSSISDDTVRVSLADTPKYLDLERKGALPKNPERWSNLHYPPDDQSQSQMLVSRMESKNSSQFKSKIPIRTANASSAASSNKPGSSEVQRNTVLLPKNNLASVSSSSMTHGTRTSRISAKSTSMTNGQTQPSQKSTTSRPTNTRVPPTLRPPVVPNRLANTSMPSLKPQTSSRVASTASVIPKPGNHYEHQSEDDHAALPRKISSYAGNSTNLLKSASAISKPSISKRNAPCGSRASELTSASTTSLAKSSSSNSLGRPRITDSSIQPPPKASAVNGVVSLPIGSSKPSLPQKSRSEFVSPNVGLKSASFNNIKSTVKLTSSSGTAINKGMSNMQLKSSSKVSVNDSLTKSISSSRLSRLSESSSSRASLKATSEAKLKPTSKLSAINVSRTTSLESHPSSYPSGGLSKKASFSGIYTPRAVPKELSRIPSPPTSHYQPKRLTSVGLPQTQARKSKPYGSTTPFAERAPSTASMSSNYYSEPLLPEEVLKTFGAKLTPYEHKEILEYKHVYYFGANSKRYLSREADVHSFSTSEGDLIFNTSDHLAYRYEIQKSLGKGSFGQVLRAYDYKVGREVAIKVIRNSERFHRQALTEIQLLDALTRWDRDGTHNVLHILDNFIFRGHLCIVTELYGINLYEYIKQNQFAGFRVGLVRNFAVQILKCLSLLSTHSVIHCDLKPENILLAGPNNSQIKVIDFGSSCYTSQRIYTYIQSRFYRSPEVILELSYGPAIDMWSFGCILAELTNGHPIFPGETEAEQMACILEVLGYPDAALLAKSKRRYSFFDVSGNPRPTLSPRRRRIVGSKPLSQILKNADDLYVDFISRCLEFCPEKRMTPAQALCHPWITGTFPSQPSSVTSASPIHTRRRATASSDLRLKETPCGSDGEINDFCSNPSSHS